MVRILLPVGTKKRGSTQCKPPRQIQIPDSEVRRKVRFGSFVFLSCLAFRCVLARSQQPMLRRAQAREGEAEELRLSFRYLDCSYVSILPFCVHPSTA